MTYQVGSVLHKTGSATEIATFIEAACFIYDINIVGDSVAGSYTVFIETEVNN